MILNKNSLFFRKSQKFLSDIIYKGSVDLAKIRKQSMYKDAFKIFLVHDFKEGSRIETLYRDFWIDWQSIGSKITW